MADGGRKRGNYYRLDYSMASGFHPRRFGMFENASPITWSRSLVALLGLCLGAAALAHGDLHEQIEAVSVEIVRAPTAELFLKRGELHRAHQDFGAALADYDRAEQLNPAMDAVRFCRGRAFFEAGLFVPARAALDLFLQKKAEHAEAFLLRARVLVGLKDFALAIKDFERAIALTPEAAGRSRFWNARKRRSRLAITTPRSPGSTKACGGSGRSLRFNPRRSKSSGRGSISMPR